MKKSRYYLTSLIKLLLIFVLAGCVSKGKILPKNLPDATLNKPYYAEIFIYVGPGPVIGRSFHYQIEPENSGIELAPYDLNSPAAYNHLAVKGSPKVTGMIKIKIAGSTYGTMFSGKEFKKIYTINVEQ